MKVSNFLQKNWQGLSVIALLAIGIAAGLLLYKRESDYAIVQQNLENQQKCQEAGNRLHAVEEKADGPNTFRLTPRFYYDVSGNRCLYSEETTDMVGSDFVEISSIRDVYTNQRLAWITMYYPKGKEPRKISGNQEEYDELARKYFPE